MMKINLTGVKPAKSTSSIGPPSAHLPANIHDSPNKAKPLDQNSKIMFSNSLHYKVVLEEERANIERKINLPITSSVHLNNREVHVLPHKVNVVVQKHHMPAPGAQAAILPWALSAGENAYFEECRAREREDSKRHEK